MTDGTTQTAATATTDGSTTATDDKVIVAPDGDQKKLQAAHDMAQAEARKANKLAADQAVRIAELEAKATETPKEDTNRIAALEVDAARSKAALKYGLSLDDAAVLKGTPAEIDSDAKYWADKLKAGKKATDTKADEPTVRDVIDKKVDDTRGDIMSEPVQQTAITQDTKPQPKQDGNLSWYQKWEVATPAEQYRMEQAADASGEDITAGFKPKP